MKKIILLFFVLKALLFSSNDFIASNGKVSFKYNTDYEKIININANIGTTSPNIDGIEVGVYYKGRYYSLSNYIASTNFIPRTNMIKTIAKLPFATVTTTYIASMIKDESIYIINEYDMIEGKESLEFLYSFDMTEKNGVVEYQKNKDYYKYNDDLYLKNLKNSMSAYIVSQNNIEEGKLSKIFDSSIKYRDEKLVLVSKMRESDSEHSDIIRVKYRKEPDFLSFETAKNLRLKETDYWNGWIKPLPNKIKGEKTREIAQRFLIYLKTSTDGENYYTNIGLREQKDLNSKLETALVFMKYNYYKDAKQILEQMLRVEDEFSYMKRSKLTVEEVKETYAYLLYMQSSEDKEFYNKNARRILKKIERIVNMTTEDQTSLNSLELGYEFGIYYYTDNLLKIYKETMGSLEYQDKERKLQNYMGRTFLVDDGIKKYRLDKKATYSKWEYGLFYTQENRKLIIDNLYENGIFRRYPYLSETKNVNIDKNLSVLSGFYRNDLNRYGDMNLIQINNDIIKNNMRIPNEVNLIRQKRYEINGIDIYLTAKYLGTIFDRSEE